MTRNLLQTFVRVAALGLPLGLPASAETLEDAFDAIAIQQVTVASFATLDRAAVDPNTNAPNGRTVDQGFFTGLVQSTSALDSFTSDTISQVRNLPLSTSVSAFTFSFDPATNVFDKDKVGLGPVMSDRAQTIGRGKINFSVSFQRADFSRFEGTKLSNIRLGTEIQQGRVYTSSPGGPAVDLANYSFLTVLLDDSGGTIRTDEPFGIGFPPAQVFDQNNVPQPQGQGCSAFAVVANPALMQTGCFFNIPNLTPGAFESPPGSGNFVNANAQAIVPDGQALLNIQSPELGVDMDLEVNVLNLAVSAGVLDNLDVSVVLPVITIDMDATVTIESFDNGCPPLDDLCNLAFAQGLIDGTTTLGDNRTRTAFDVDEDAAGIGDLQVRGKYQLPENDFIDSAVRGTVVFPTGREEDFLGTGHFAGEFAVVGSKTLWKRLAPHATAAVFVSENDEANQLRYRAGVDVILHERLNAGADLIGSHDFQQDGIGDDILSLGAGLKWNPWGRLVLTGAAIVRLNDEGLRADVIPAFNIEYTLD